MTSDDRPLPGPGGSSSLVARLLWWAAALSASGVVAFVGYAFVAQTVPAYLSLTACAYLSGTVLVLIALQLKRTEAGIALFLAANWIAALCLLVAEGPTTGHFGVFFVTVVLAGLLRHPRWAAFVGLASALAVVAVHVVEARGHTFPGTVVSSQIWAMQVSQLVVAGFLTALVTQSFHDALGQLRDSEEVLAARNAELLAQQEVDARLERLQRLEAIGRLAGGVAHDLNNVLTVILANAELIQAEPDQAEELASDIAAAGRSAARVTSKLLALSRRPPMGVRTVDMSTVVRELASWFGRLRGASIQLEVHADEPLFVDIDPARLEQILLNLIVNALDAMLDQGRLTVRTAVAEDKAMLAVSDTGVGMCPDALERLFDPHFTTKGPGRGTGLGMATVDAIVREAGGQVQVESAPGRGTTVSVSFPRVGAPAGQHEPSPTPTPLPGRRVLLVDDDPGVRGLAHAILTDAGHDVTPCDSVEAARKHLEEGHAVELLVSDVVLADGNGPEVATALRARSPDVPVLYISGYTAGILRSHPTRDSDGFLPKPFGAESLLAAVGKALQPTR